MDVREMEGNRMGTVVVVCRSFFVNLLDVNMSIVNECHVIGRESVQARVLVQGRAMTVSDARARLGARDRLGRATCLPNDLVSDA